MTENRTVCGIWGHDSTVLNSVTQTLTHSPFPSPHPPLRSSPPQAGAVLCLGSDERLWKEKVCRPLLSARLIGHLPTGKTPCHGDPLAFFTNKDPPHLMPPPPGRREADILEKKKIWSDVKRVWLLCRFSVCMEECHLFSEQTDDDF